METSRPFRTFTVLRHPVTTLRAVTNTAPTTRAGWLIVLSQAGLILSVGLAPVLIFRLLRDIAERCGLSVPDAIYDDMFAAVVALALFASVAGSLMALAGTAVGAMVVNTLVHRLVKPNKGNSSGLFAGTGFAQVPLLLLVPVSILGAVAAVAIGGVAGLLVGIIVPLLGLATFALWSIALAFIALRENYGLTTLRALAAMLIPIGVAGAVVALLALAFGSLEVEASFNFDINADGCKDISARPSRSIPTPVSTPAPKNPAVARVTRMAGSSYQPAWHPTGDSLAFISDAGGDWDIYRIDVDGSGLVKMTNDPGSDQDPAWSPDGTKIAFISTRAGNPDIYNIFVMNADGTGITRLTDEPGGSFQPAWSPDGARIAFTSMRSGDFEIYIMNADGSGVVNLSQNADSRDRYPSWSPDGAKIAFISGDLAGGRTFLQVANADGSAAERLTEATDGSRASWSPSGDAVTFARFPDIFIIKADGSGLTQLTNDPATDRSPAWSPDGDRIAFSSGLGSDSDIYIIDLRSAVTIRPAATQALSIPTPTPTPTPLIRFTPTPTPTPVIRFTPTPTPSPTPLPLRFNPSGTIDIPQTLAADLDLGVLSGEADADIWFRASTGQVHYLAPVNGAKAEYRGGSPPGRDGCATASYSTGEVLIKVPSPGFYVCVLTNEGRYSELRVYSGEDAGSVRVTFTTWE